MPRVASLAAFLALVFATSVARATVTEPNGLVVPLDSMNGEIQLYTFFSSRGEGIDWQRDGNDMPAVFSPLCDFRATFVLHQAGDSNGVGWYNADATSTPSLSDIHLIVPAGSPVGTVITAADIRSDPNYHGGAVGFALVGHQTHYTEPQWNPTCTACTPPGPWILAVIYHSTLDAHAYYVCFEDGSVDASSFGNDGDFNDDVFYFEGLSCMGGDQPCDTGMQGICAQGLTQCTPTGVSCQPAVTPRPEQCNGLDDNCNGMVDDGMGLCPPNYICERGMCVPACVEGSCFSGQVCVMGACVEADCATVTCPAGQVCSGGTCHAPCDGVVCPGNQVCRAGRCVDPCAGVTCPPGEACSDGVCITSCTCLPCASGMACDMATGVCTDPACATVACSGNQVCRSGHCQDPCTGAMCPSGQTCTGGNCVDAPMDAGVADSGTHDSGVRDASASDARRDGALDGARDATSGDARRDGGGGGVVQSGCGCRAEGGRGARNFVWLALFGATVLARRRRSRVRSRA